MEDNKTYVLLNVITVWEDGQKSGYPISSQNANYSIIDPEQLAVFLAEEMHQEYNGIKVKELIIDSIMFKTGRELKEGFANFKNILTR
jgi:hypothetical protein